MIFRESRIYFPWFGCHESQLFCSHHAHDDPYHHRQPGSYDEEVDKLISEACATEVSADLNAVKSCVLMDLRFSENYEPYVV